MENKKTQAGTKHVNEAEEKQILLDEAYFTAELDAWVRSKSHKPLPLNFILDVECNEGRVNMMASVYGKGSNGKINYAWYVRHMINGDLIYADMRKATKFLAPAGV